MIKRKSLLAAMLAMTMVVLFASTALAAQCDFGDHRFGDWKLERRASCVYPGKEYKRCSKCKMKVYRSLPKLKHTPGRMIVTKEPTCTETGRRETECKVCDQTLTYTIEKLPHSNGEMTVIRKSTCTEKGKAEYTCEDCGYVTRGSIEELGHDWGKMLVTTEPTCTKAGAAEETCLRCNYTQKTTLARTEHPWGEWTIEREPQGKRKGLRVSVCTGCGREQEEYFFWEGTLYEGMDPCEEVIALQEKLRDLGFYGGAIRSGQFGSLTTSAVAKFQESVNLEDNGIADPKTLEALNSAWEKKTGRSAQATLAPEDMEGAQQAQIFSE